MTTSTIDQVSDLLGQLPNDRAELETFFEARGVKGVPRDPFCCLLSRYLHDATGDDITTTRTAALVFGKPAPNRAVLSTELSQFTRDFDTGQHPRLETEEHFSPLCNKHRP